MLLETSKVQLSNLRANYLESSKAMLQKLETGFTATSLRSQPWTMVWTESETYAT